MEAFVPTVPANLPFICNYFIALVLCSGMAPTANSAPRHRVRGEVSAASAPVWAEMKRERKGERESHWDHWLFKQALAPGGSPGRAGLIEVPRILHPPSL